MRNYLICKLICLSHLAQGTTFHSPKSRPSDRNWNPNSGRRRQYILSWLGGSECWQSKDEYVVIQQPSNGCHKMTYQFGLFYCSRGRNIPGSIPLSAPLLPIELVQLPLKIQMEGEQMQLHHCILVLVIHLNCRSFITDSHGGLPTAYFLAHYPILASLLVHYPLHICFST